MEVTVQLHALAALALGKRPWYPLSRWLGEPQNLFRHLGEGKVSHTPARNQTTFLPFPSLYCSCYIVS